MLSPAARMAASHNAAVLPLPLVPAMWTAGICLWGLPSRSTNASIRVRS